MFFVVSSKTHAAVVDAFPVDGGVVFHFEVESFSALTQFSYFTPKTSTMKVNVMGFVWCRKRPGVCFVGT